MCYNGFEARSKDLKVENMRVDNECFVLWLSASIPSLGIDPAWSPEGVGMVRCRFGCEMRKLIIIRRISAGWAVDM
jgi:hypothetical protein